MERMASTVSSSQIEQALFTKLPALARLLINPKDAVSVFRERTTQREGPFTIRHLADYQVLIQNGW